MAINLQRVIDVSQSEITSQAHILDGVSVIGRAYDFARHPYFVWIRDSRTQLEEFRQSQLPYLYLVEGFSRSLAAVLARVGPLDQRLCTIYPNVAEEHGYGDGAKSHRTTYLDYLKSIGVNDDALQRECPIRVSMVSDALLGFCLTNSAEVGAAALGIIEYTHIKIATMIAQNILDRFWGDLDAQQHYQLHAEIDAEHALSLFALCEDGWAVPTLRQRISHGLLYGAQLWWSVFDWLCPAAIIAPSETDTLRPLLEPGARADEHPVVARESPRIPCALPLRWRSDGGRPTAATAVAINRFGLELAPAAVVPPDIHDQLELDEDIHIELGLGDPDPPLELAGRVRSRPSSAARHGIYIEFCGLVPAEEERLAGLIKHLQA